MVSSRPKAINISLRLLIALCIGASATMAVAQSFPSKPIRIIVPFPPGGAVDAIMRRMGPAITESTGQAVVIDNRPGGLTNIGMQACASAPPDGYTVCFTLDDSVVYNPLLFTKLPYDPMTLTPVMHVASPQSLLVANASAPYNNVKELVAYAKSKPGAVNFGTWGPASAPDLYRQWVNHTFGIDLVGVPYKGVGTGTLPAVISGEIGLTIIAIGQVMPMIQSGKVKPIAVLGSKRWPGLPNVSALSEDGSDPALPSVWGVYAPPQTPPAVVSRLNAEFAKALATPSVREIMQTNTLDAVGGSPADFARTLTDLRTNATRVFRTLDIKPTDAPS